MEGVDCNWRDYYSSPANVFLRIDNLRFIAKVQAKDYHSTHAQPPNTKNYFQQ